MISDFENRADIPIPTTKESFQIFYQKLMRCIWKRKPRVVRQYNRGKAKVKNDLDLVKIIQKLRRHSVQLWCLMTESQRKFSHKIAERVLSEYSSLDDEIAEALKKEVEDRGQYFDKFSSDGDKKPSLDYDSVLDPMLRTQAETAKTQRLLNIYA